MASKVRFRVLVVDEGAVLASMVRWILARPDLDLVGTARNASEALEAVERLRPDLVILEAVLPGMDGFRLARALKSREEAPLVVLATFHASAAARDEARAAGADGFLAKFDFTDGFAALLEEWRSIPDSHPARVKTPAIPDRRGSRTLPDP